MNHSRNLTGKKFGRLLAIQRNPSATGRPRWDCVCDCGTLVVVRSDSLLSAKTQSCGCLHADVSRDRWARLNTKHGLNHSPGYVRWNAMMTRCHNPRSSSYHRYGGRGIVVCERWRNDPLAFIADMGEPPPGMSLDRIDNNGPYSPGNCRWVDRKGQQNNRRNCRMLTFNGRTQTLTLWAEEIGVSPSTVRKRFKLGWPIARALTP